MRLIRNIVAYFLSSEYFVGIEVLAIRVRIFSTTDVAYVLMNCFAQKCVNKIFDEKFHIVPASSKWSGTHHPNQIRFVLHLNQINFQRKF